jgi:hypothetical protein
VRPMQGLQGPYGAYVLREMVSFLHHLNRFWRINRCSRMNDVLGLQPNRHDILGEGERFRNEVALVIESRRGVRSGGRSGGIGLRVSTIGIERFYRRGREDQNGGHYLSR